MWRVTGMAARYEGSLRRRSTMLTATLLPLALLGCNNANDEQEFTTDVRIDFADGGNDPDSTDTEMCVTPDGVVYVLWLDDREDPDSGNYDIWMNRSVN